MTNKNQPSTAVTLGLFIEHVRAHVRTKQAIALMNESSQPNLYQATVAALEANTRYIRYLHLWLQNNGVEASALYSVMSAAGYELPNN